jgi:hypothetical protein
MCWRYDGCYMGRDCIMMGSDDVLRYMCWRYDGCYKTKYRPIHLLFRESLDVPKNLCVRESERVL